MKLSFEQIRDITNGAETVAKGVDAVQFFRFSKAEQHLYSETENYRKVFSTAGVRMDFRTDGDSLYLKIKTSVATSRTYFSMDIIENGKYIGSIKNFDDEVCDSDYTQTEFPLGGFMGKFSLAEGDKHISIIFPWSVATEIEELEIKNSTYIIPVKSGKKVMVLGDSITQGYDAMYTNNAYAVKLRDVFDAEVYNKAIGGEVFFPELVNAQRGIAPDYITVAYGTNDWSMREQDDFKVRCNDFFSNLAKAYPKALIFSITPIWRSDYKGERKFGDFFDVEEYIKKVCSEYKNIKVISGYDLVPHNERMYADLRLHPNDNGFKYYRKNLKKEIGFDEV